jgi:hypothetical protein
MSEQVRISTLKSGVWILGRFVFASGKEANNKFDMPVALRVQASRRPLIGRMAALAAVYDPDALWGVPSGGQEYAEELGEHMELPVIQLSVTRANGKKEFHFATHHDRVLAARSVRKVGVEDITNEFTSTNATLLLPELQNTVGMVAGARRGTPETEQLPGMPVDWAFEMQVPNIITPDHPLFQQYGQFAVGEFVAL